MANFFSAVLDFLKTIGHLCNYLLKGIQQLFLMIPAAFTMLTYSIGYLPSILIAFAALSITLAIIFLILGR